MKSIASAKADTSARGRRRPGVEEQRRLILEAAVELFAARGSGAASVSDICKAARVSRDTYYRCFADKDALVSHLYQTSVNDHMLAVINASDLDYSDQQWLHKVFDQTIDAILDQHKVAQFLFIEAADPNSYAYMVINDAYDKVAQRMQNWCKTRYGRTPSPEFFKSLLVASQWLVHNAIIQGLDPKHVEAAKQAAEQLFYGAFNSIENYPV